VPLDHAAPPFTEADGVIAFWDLTGFQRLMNAHPAKTLLAIVDQYAEIVDEAVRGTLGVTDNLFGDCILAHWGVATPIENRVRRALETARNVARRFLEGTIVDPSAGVRCGIAAGRVAYACPAHRAPTVYGKPVNRAAGLLNTDATATIRIEASALESLHEGVSAVPGLIEGERAAAEIHGLGQVEWVALSVDPSWR
jgi:class 3 adenylate cyclase